MTREPALPCDDLAAPARAARELAALAPRRRGRKPIGALSLKVAALRKRAARLQARLARAHKLRAAQDELLRGWPDAG